MKHCQGTQRGRGPSVLHGHAPFHAKHRERHKDTAPGTAEGSEPKSYSNQHPFLPKHKNHRNHSNSQVQVKSLLEVYTL